MSTSPLIIGVCSSWLVTLSIPLISDITMTSNVIVSDASRGRSTSSSSPETSSSADGGDD